MRLPDCGVVDRHGERSPLRAIARKPDGRHSSSAGTSAEVLVRAKLVRGDGGSCEEPQEQSVHHARVLHGQEVYARQASSSRTGRAIPLSRSSPNSTKLTPSGEADSATLWLTSTWPGPARAAIRAARLTVRPK
jgi:hypothetical protein